jgi:hypothetical protein
MFKLIKILLLLAIVVGVGVAAYVYLQKPTTPATGTAKEIRSSKESDKPRVEEKYGYTSEGVDGP